MPHTIAEPIAKGVHLSVTHDVLLGCLWYFVANGTSETRTHDDDGVVFNFIFLPTGPRRIAPNSSRLRRCTATIAFPSFFFFLLPFGRAPVQPRIFTGRDGCSSGENGGKSKIKTAKNDRRARQDAKITNCQRSEKIPEAIRLRTRRRSGIFGSPYAVDGAVRNTTIDRPCCSR